MKNNSQIFSRKIELSAELQAGTSY